MKVILQVDVKGSGKKGQLIEVSDGYGRNYLLPRKLAVQANAENLNVMKTQDAARQHKVDVEKEAARSIVSKIDGKTLTIPAKGGKSGKLYGAVTTKDLAEKIGNEFGVELDKRKINCGEIKTFGTYTAEIKVYPEIAAKMTIEVVEEAE